MRHSLLYQCYAYAMFWLQGNSKNHLSKKPKINKIMQNIAVYRRITKLVWIGWSTVLSGEKTARVICDDGLPVFSSQCFISLILSSAPSISPFTVSSRVFRHQPVKPSRSACCLVYLRKNTPWTRPNTSNSHKYRDIALCPPFSLWPQKSTNRRFCFGNQTEFNDSP